MKKTYTIKEWLLQIKEQVGEVGETHPFVAILLISDLIEFVGNCISNCSAHRAQFEYVINHIPAFDSYRSINNLYRNLRCGLTHAMKPENGIELVDKGNNIINGETIRISFESLYRDFSRAIDQVMAGENGLRTERLNTPYIDVFIDELPGVTAETSTNITVTRR